MACSPAYSLASMTLLAPGWMTRVLSYPHFCVTVRFFQTLKAVFSVDSGGESRALRQHKPVWTKLKEHISENPNVPENPACREECYNNIKLWNILWQPSFTAQEAKCCPYAMDESTSWKLSKSWQSHMQTTQDTPALSLNLRLSTKKKHVPTAILSLKPSHQISNATVHKDAISYTLTLHPTCFTKRCSSAVSAFFQHPAASVLHTKEHHQENPSIAVSLRILR